VGSKAVMPDVPAVAPVLQPETTVGSDAVVPKVVPVAPIIQPKSPVVGSPLL
jgi:hypothetical protein